jgi:hypothetical protein
MGGLVNASFHSAMRADDPFLSVVKVIFEARCVSTLAGRQRKAVRRAETQMEGRTRDSTRR